MIESSSISYSVNCVVEITHVELTKSSTYVRAGVQMQVVDDCSFLVSSIHTSGYQYRVDLQFIQGIWVYSMPYTLV